MKITIEIEVGTASTADWWDISEALDAVTKTREPITEGSTGTVQDKDGNYVGQWTISNDPIGDFTSILA